MSDNLSILRPTTHPEASEQADGFSRGLSAARTILACISLGTGTISMFPSFFMAAFMCVLCVFPLILAILAAVLGAIAIRQIELPDSTRLGWALLGASLGVISLVESTSFYLDMKSTKYL